ncbi:gph [Acrasis kona]|uniref:Gph n=1 Tax=Acrasis kona TaxID=1008807 RepID=A0AAW2Z7F0_9EUKA
MNIKFVVFDVGNVLAGDFYISFLEDIIRDQLLVEVANMNTDQRDKAMEEITEAARLAMNEFKLGEVDEDTFFQMVIDGSRSLHYVLNHAGLDNIKAIKHFKEVIRRDHFKLYKDVIKVAQEIKSQGKCKLGILSNHVKEWFSEVLALDNNYIRKVFDDDKAIVISCDPDVKAFKPNANVYEKLIDRLRSIDSNLIPEQILFIDDKQRNVNAAKKVGINSFVFDARYHGVKSNLVPSLLEYGIDILVNKNLFYGGSNSGDVKIAKTV